MKMINNCAMGCVDCFVCFPLWVGSYSARSRTEVDPFLNVHGRARSSVQPGPCSFIKVKTVTYLLYIKKKTFKSFKEKLH